MAEHIQGKYHRQATLFGRPAVARRLRSIKALGDTSGIDPQRIRLLIKSEGYLAPRPKGIGRPAVLSPAAADVIVSSLRDGCTAPQLRRLLGARPNQVRALIDLGLIPPVGWRKDKQLFSRAAAAAILAKIKCQLDGQPALITQSLKPVTSARIQQIATDGEVLKLIIGKKLKLIGTSYDGVKLASLLVSPNELVELTGREWRGLTSVQIALRLKVRASLCSELWQSGYLAKHNILTSGSVKLTAVSNVEAFERRYISLGQVAHKLGVRPQAARSLLKQANVQCLPLPGGTHSIFKRGHVLAAFPQLK